jgi:hypothetical protein
MAQQIKKSPNKQDTKSLKDLRATAQASTDIEEKIPQKARGPLAAGILLMLLLIFFGKALSPEKTFNAGDNIASEAVLPYLNAAQASG